VLNPAMPYRAPGAHRATGVTGPPPLPHGARTHSAADLWDLVTVPARQGLEAVDIIRRSDAGAVGPVLHDTPCATLGFLVPPGTSDGWDLPGSACTQTLGRGFHPGTAPPVAGTGWLLPPQDPDRVTDPAVLRAALGEAARTIEAADGRG
jgi:hypothetical protein